ncbi:ABC transporter permease [Acidothermaceae bacterium B102]|nr:ABC transporter permease [Acidothermaceae bacterium B102]
MSVPTTVRPATELAEEGSGRRERLTATIQQLGGVGMLVIVVVVASAVSHDKFGFATKGNFETIVSGSAFTGLLALGMTFVIISGGIDLSVGSVFALGGVLAARGAQHGTWTAILYPLVFCAFFGLVQGVVIARFRMPPFIVTLAGLSIARGLEQVVTKDGNTTYQIKPGSVFLTFGGGTWRAIAIFVVAFALGALLLQATRFGQALFAIGGNENAALLMGVPIARTKVLVYVLSATLAGAGGALNASRSLAGPVTVGTGFELTAIAATVIGGTLLAGGAGSVSGTAAGVLLLAVISNLIGRYLSDYGSAASDAVNGGFLALVIVLQAYLTRVQRIQQ